MLGINSSVKNITERLNPLSQRNKISKLKFERKKDYKTFLDFIKKNTKEIEGTGVDGVKEKLSKGVLGLGGIGIIAALFGGGSGLDPVGEGNRRFNTLQNVIRKRKADAKKFNLSTEKRGIEGSRITKIFKKTKPLVKDSIKVAKKYRKIKKRQIALKNAENKQKNRTVNKQYSKKEQNVNQNNARRNKQSTTTTEVGGDTTNTKKSSTATIDNNQGKQGPTGGTRGRSGRNQPDLSKLERMAKEADNIRKRINEKLNDPNFRVPDKIQKEVARINRQLSRTDLTSSTRDRLTERLSNIDKNIKEIQKQNKKFQSSKFFEAPEVPKRKTSKLSNLGNFNRFSGNILNNPFVRLTSSVFGFIVNAKGEIIRTTLTPTQLGPTDEEERRLIEQFSEKPVNIFLNNGQSMLPFNQDLKLNNGVTPPTDFPTPSSNVFIDPKQQLNIDDLFFLRSFSGG